MAPRAGVAYAEIVPKLASGFAGDLEKQFSKPVEDSGSRVGASLGKVAGLIGGAFAAKGIFDFGKNAIEAATESNKIAAQTEAVIKSTGGAAKVTAGQISDLATSISNKTGVDDEAIQSASNLLLTFTNLKNGVGKSNDVFNQATKIAVDMGAALGGDASSNAIQLGKALNDPVKGIAALSRVGVTFTDQQKDQIKTMVAAGDTMGAQKVILGELNKEFGGSAEAQATAGDKLKVVWGNVQEQIGNQLLPIFNKVATFAAENLPAAIDFAGAAFTRINQLIQPVVGFFKNAAEQISFLGNAWKYAGVEGVAEIFDNIFGATGRLIGPLTTFGTIVQTVAGFVADNLKPILIGLGITIALLTAPISTVIAALILAYAHFETFRNVVNGVIDFLTNVVGPAVANVAGYIIGQFSSLVAWVQQYWPQISEAIGHVIAAIETVIRTTIGVITILWQQWGDDLLRMVQTAFEFVRGTIDNALQVIRGIIQTVTALINGDWGKAWDGFKQILAGIWDQITNAVRTAIDGVKSLLGGIASTAGEAFGAMVEAIVKAILSIPGRIANIGKDILSKLIPDIPGSGIIEGVLKHLPGFASGGFVPGPIGRPQLAIVHGGEEIITADRAGNGAGGFHIGEVNLIGTRATPAELSAELAWYRRTSGR